MPDPPSRLSTFLSELKRRRVFRVAAVYAGVAFIISEIVANTFGYLNLPDSFGTAVIVILIIGFPIVIGLAWAFDLTDEGIVRAKGRPADAKRKAQPLLGNKSLAVIAVLAIIVAVWALLREPAQPGDTVINSVAVLPLENLMGDPEQEYFVEGMHEAIITELSRLSALRVIGRTSTLIYKGNPKPIPEIAEELDVDAVIEGSVFGGLDEDTVRITAQLIATRPERHLRSIESVATLSGYVSLQKTIAQAIVAEIGLILTPEEKAQLASAPQVNPEALKLYQRGWQLRNLETPESIALAVEYLEQAVVIDPDYADAWAALIPSYNMASGYDLTPDSNVTWGTLRKVALDKALELDPNNVVALVWHGYVGGGGDDSYRRALELEPSNVYARYEYGLRLARSARPNEGLAELLLAHELDPINPLPLYGLGGVYWLFRQYEQGLEYEQAALALSPDMESARMTAKMNEFEILIEQGRCAEAAAGAARWLAEETIGRGYFLWIQLRAESALGNREHIYAIRDSLITAGYLPQQEQENPMRYARLYAVMGEKEQALNLLERADEDDTLGRQTLIFYPEFDFLRAEPRFKALFQKREWQELFDENGNLLQPIDETLEAYNAPGSR